MRFDDDPNPKFYFLISSREHWALLSETVDTSALWTGKSWAHPRAPPGMMNLPAAWKSDGPDPGGEAGGIFL